MREHLTPADMEAFLQGRLSKERARGVVRHLLRGCVSCAAELREERGRLAIQTALELSVDNESAYARVLKRASRMARHLQRETARAREIGVLLVQGGVKAVVQDADLPLAGFGVYQALLDRCRAVRHENPREMVSLARAATDVAGRLDPSLYGFLQVADWQARAWGELANALRVADDLDEAERAFGVAFEFFRKGSEDSFLKVHLYDLHASFLGTRRQFGLAFSVLDIVLSLYLELGDRHLAGRALIKKAVYTHYSGQPDVAIQLSDQGLSLLEKGREPELSFLAAHNKIWYLVACGRFRKAKKELFLHRSDFQNLEGSINHLKLRWLQAQVGAGLNEWKSAEAALLEVSEGFEAAGMGFHAALASLDLSLLWMRLGRLREAEDLGMDAADVFLALGIHREALGCVMILRDAFEKRKATVVLLEGVIEFLRRSQIDPDARFIPRF
ncbi:MAG: hypothetical protein QOF89_6011 [Acidobacteriota bacterium]|nr:hypothetical protein [Acidobacteriota bacterium]